MCTLVIGGARISVPLRLHMMKGVLQESVLLLLFLAKKKNLKLFKLWLHAKNILQKDKHKNKPQISNSRTTKKNIHFYGIISFGRKKNLYT